MATQYNSNYGETVPFSDTCAQIHCATGAEETFTIPGTAVNSYQVTFGYALSSNVFVRLNGVPTLPGSGVVQTLSYSEFNPHKRYVKGGDVLHFITPDTDAYIGVSLLSLP